MGDSVVTAFAEEGLNMFFFMHHQVKGNLLVSLNGGEDGLEVKALTLS